MENLIDLKDLKLSELRELYPDIKATSKTKFLELVDELLTKEKEKVENGESTSLDAVESHLDIVEYLLEKAESREKILIEFETSMEADDAFVVLEQELFGQLAKKGIGVSASSNRRDMSLNGSCYVRLTCRKNYELLKSLVKYTEIKKAY